MAAGHETIWDRLRAHAATDPERVAYRFLTFPASESLGRDHKCTAPTYRELLTRATALGSALRARLAPGARVLLALPTGQDFVVALFACFAARVIAVPVKPVSLVRGGPAADRFRRVIADCAPELALTSAHVRDLGWLADPDGPPVLTLDELPPTSRPLEPPRADDIAFLQYTSGSTAAPRGVVVRHRNLADNERTIAADARYTPADVMCCWLPLSHDFGLVGGVLQPVWTGFPSVLFAPEAFVAEPVRWLRAISDFRVTVTGAPNFAFELCAKRIPDAKKAGLNLSTLRVVKNGAEPIRAATLAAFTNAFADYGFRPEAWLPCYGLAEATLFVSGGPPGKPRLLHCNAGALEAGQVRAAEAGAVARILTSCGKPGTGFTVVATDPDTGVPVEPGRIGELWVQSDSVADGYWQKPDAGPFGHHLPDGRGPFLRTGDLGFMDAGDVFVAGRLKDLIIIRGRNIYPQDVEIMVEEALGEGAASAVAAFAFDAADEERVGIAIEATRTLWRQVTGDTAEKGLKDVARAVRTAMSNAFEVRPAAVAVLKPGSFPRTTSGKLQRGECRKLVLNPDSDEIRVHREAAASPA